MLSYCRKPSATLSRAFFSGLKIRLHQLQPQACLFAVCAVLIKLTAKYRKIGGNPNQTAPCLIHTKRCLAFLIFPQISAKLANQPYAADTDFLHHIDRFIIVKNLGCTDYLFRLKRPLSICQFHFQQTPIYFIRNSRHPWKNRCPTALPSICRRVPNELDNKRKTTLPSMRCSSNPKGM